jgi:D-alanine-D-alanine ligase-like ATP-grasp enzyme
MAVTARSEDEGKENRKTNGRKSAECEVSMKSGEAIYDALRERGYVKEPVYRDSNSHEALLQAATGY